jgi:hypothetical protein
VFRPAFSASISLESFSNSLRITRLSASAFSSRGVFFWEFRRTFWILTTPIFDVAGLSFGAASVNSYAEQKVIKPAREPKIIVLVYIIILSGIQVFVSTVFLISSFNNKTF